MIELKPIRETPKDYDGIEERIKALFRKEIYLPLIKEFATSTKKLQNSRNDLIQALQSGRLTFNQGKFTGKLNAALSKELESLGATWNKRLQCYSLPLKEIPLDVRNTISSSAWRFEEKISKIDAKLASILPEQLADKLQISKIFDKALWKVEKDFQKSVKKVTVAPQVTDFTRKKISDEWQNNMTLWIKDFTEKQIKELRQNLLKSVFAGNRYEHAIKTIQASYGVTDKKAKFLARQETALAMTTYKYARYQEAGIGEYKWRAVKGTPLHPVRPMHRELSDRSDKGEVFKFTQPPIDDPNGSRHNPGQNYNCRCVAIPIVTFKK